MTDQEYTIACLRDEKKKLEEAIQKFMQQVDRRMERPYDKGAAMILPYNKAKAEVKNLINPVKKVSQELWERL